MMRWDWGGEVVWGAGRGCRYCSFLLLRLLVNWLYPSTSREKAMWQWYWPAPLPRPTRSLLPFQGSIIYVNVYAARALPRGAELQSSVEKGEKVRGWRWRRGACAATSKE
jgi:hypothetical protein